MERLARRGLDILGKAASLLGVFAFTLVGGRPSQNSGDSGNHPYKPMPETHSMLTSNPLIPAFLVLMFILLLLFSAPVQNWFARGGDLPNLAQFLAHFQRKEKSAGMTAASERVGVWAIKQFGFYYCQGGVLFGSDRGEWMTQSDALASGYRPAGGQYCIAGKPRVASAGSVPFRVKQWFRSATNNLPSATDLLDRFRKGHPALPKASELVTVWTKKQFGLYYCQSDVLFGRKPGQPMKQVAALLSGYRPASHRYCTNTKPDEASAGRLPLPASPGGFH